MNPRQDKHIFSGRPWHGHTATCLLNLSGPMNVPGMPNVCQVNSRLTEFPFNIPNEHASLETLKELPPLSLCSPQVLDLPRELRDEIHRFLIPSCTTLRFAPPTWRENIARWIVDVRCDCQHTLLQSSRQASRHAQKQAHCSTAPTTLDSPFVKDLGWDLSGERGRLLIIQFGLSHNLALVRSKRVQFGSSWTRWTKSFLPGRT
jgi:hypothetical protein